LTLAKVLREFLPTVYAQHGPLNARQYAYQALVAGLVSKKQFDYVNTILTELREKGLLPWSAVLDSSRDFEPYAVASSEDPGEYVAAEAEQFRSFPDRFDLPMWQYQRVVPVILTEKDGLIKYFQMIAERRAVSIYAQKGQVGKSHLHEVVFPWMMKWAAAGKKIGLLYLGDADDEGFQIPLTLLQTITKWAGGAPEFDIRDLYPRHRSQRVHEGSMIMFDRLALKPEQVDEFELVREPINPKSKIARKFVDYRCELEAMKPDVLRGIIIQALDQTWDEKAEQRRRDKVEEMRKPIKERFGELTKNWR